MAFKVYDVAVELMLSQYSCSCGPASGGVTGGACPEPSKVDIRGEAKAGRLPALKAQLSQTLAKV